MSSRVVPPVHRFPRKWIYFGLLLLLMAGSNVARYCWPPESGPREDQRVAQVREFEIKSAPRERVQEAARAVPTGRLIDLAYADLPPAGREDAPVLVLLHGMAGDGRDFAGLVEKLAPHYRLLVPDLPGAGRSQRKVADYSAAAAAHTVLDLLDGQAVARAHFLGFGQGGAVALNIAHAAPERVASVSLVSSVGAQEFELLGNHLVNQIVYGFHLFFVKVAEDVVPHFGLLDRTPVNTAYARGFWDSDFTEIKDYLLNYAGPLFLAHGEDDWLVSVETARYSARAAPQAKTFYAEGGHWTLLREPATLAGSLLPFLEGADAGQGGRAAAAAPLELPPPPPAEGARLWILMLIIIVCAFVAEDPTLLASGLLVSQGILSFTAATTACLVSIFIGDFTLYLIGYVLGRPALRKAPLKWIIPEYEVDRMANWFEKKGFQGLLLIITSRVIPASRLPTFVCAGVMRLSMWRLTLLFIIAAALWAPALIWLAEQVGSDVIGKFEHWKHQALWIVLGLVFFLWLLMHVLVPAVTWRGRRMLVMKLRRWSRHEFWPTWMLYGPLATYVIWEGLRRLSLAGFTAANPGLGRQGGFTGEAKSTMFSALGKAAPVAPWHPVPGGKNKLEERVEVARNFMETRGLQYPVVLKPDIGDDGMSVNIIHSNAQLREWLELFKEDAIIQQWIDGEEFEVVWSRMPGETRGRILAVVEKRPVTVLGDGHRTLEDLIWADDRAVSLGKLYLRFNWRRAGEVIPAGTAVTLSRIGTHRCGVQAIDRQELRLEPLAMALDRIADAVPGGLHHVIYDVRVRDVMHLRVGRELTVTGVSGAGSVSSRLHDQYVRLGYALASSRRQIRRAFVAADVLRVAGGKPASVWEVLATWGEARGRRLLDLRNE